MYTQVALHLLTAFVFTVMEMLHLAQQYLDACENITQQ